MDELVEYLEDEAGSSLRAIGVYHGSDYELQHHRDDLDPEILVDRLRTIQANITWEWRPPDEGTIEELGKKIATLQVRKQAVILHLLVGKDHGIVIGLDPEAARNLNTFIIECLERVDGAPLPG